MCAIGAQRIITALVEQSMTALPTLNLLRALNIPVLACATKVTMAATVVPATHALLATIVQVLVPVVKELAVQAVLPLMVALLI